MIMPIPVAAGIPALYELLVGSGLLVGGALTAKQMQKEMEQNPQVMEEALKNVFMGPTKDLINPDILKNIIESKPVTTDQGTTKKEVMETEVSPDDQGMFFASPEVRQFLFKDTPSGMVLGPDAAEIEKKRQEAAPKPLVTPIPPKEETKLETPVLSEADKTKTESFPAQTPEKQILQTPPAKSVDTSILTKEKKEITAPTSRDEMLSQLTYKKSKKDKNITEAYLGDKKVGELEKMTELPKMNGMYDYQVYLTNEQGETDFDNMDVQLGFNSAKDMMATGLWNKMKAEAPAAPVKFEYPTEEVRNQELNLAKDLFELSQNNPTLDMYEQYKNNPIIKNKIESSNKAYNDTSIKEGYGTADYWTNRKFVGDTVGYKDFIKKVYGNGAPKKNKEMFIVMGPSSSGKSSSLVDKLVPETGSYLADSDEIKKLLPEFTDGYNAGGVHKESSDINQRIMKIALARGDNIVYPTTGRDEGKLAKEIKRAEKYGYTPKVYLVTADREVLLMRNLARMLSTNRVVDSDLLLNEQLIKDINQTYENLPEKYKAGKYDTSKNKR